MLAKLIATLSSRQITASERVTASKPFTPFNTVSIMAPVVFSSTELACPPRHGGKRVVCLLERRAPLHHVLADAHQHVHHLGLLLRRKLDELGLFLPHLALLAVE